MPEVYVAIGSNVEPERHLRAALVGLADNFGVLRLSQVYRNPPVGFEGRDFLNMVAAFDTDLPVDEIAVRLEQIEDENGRVRDGPKFGPRTLDIDLLLYGDEITRQGSRDIPRDEITRYAFVLRPLVDLAGEKTHPGSDRTYEELWQEFDAEAHPLEPEDLRLFG